MLFVLIGLIILIGLIDLIVLIGVIVLTYVEKYVVCVWVRTYVYAYVRVCVCVCVSMRMLAKINKPGQTLSHEARHNRGIAAVPLLSGPLYPY